MQALSNQRPGWQAPAAPDPRTTAAQWQATARLRAIVPGSRREHDDFDFFRVDLTPELARVLISLNAGNRPLRPGTVRHYARAMAAGRWHVASDVGVTVAWLPDGSCRLIDGQHRCQGVIEAGVTIPGLKFFSLHATDEAAQAIYAKMDTGRGRRTTDVIRVQTTARGLRSIGVAITGLSLIEVLIPEGYTTFRELDNELRADLFARHEDEATWAADLRERYLFGGKRLGAGTLAAAIETRRVADSAAEEFWEQVGTGELLARGDPTYALREALLRHGAAGMNYLGMLRQRAIALLAWRHFCHDTKVKLLKPSGESFQSLTAIAVATPRAKR